MSFISEVADFLLDHHRAHLGRCTVVFPNQRSGLFLKKSLSKKVNKPVWSPTILSLENFLFSFSTINKVDPLTLIFELYGSFKRHNKSDESFDSFYYWSEMLLKDFEEVDHYLVDPKQLFTYVKDDRQLAEDFYFLDEKQEAIIQKFWQKFLPTSTKTQEQFVETWKILEAVYSSFKTRLQEKNIGYTSHIYRELASRIEDISIPEDRYIIFAGFNALTPVEEQLIKHFVINFQAKILWDIDEYYIANENQEAGSFMRQYVQDSIFSKGFSNPLPKRIEQPKTIEVTGVSLEAGQAKLVGEEINKLLSNGAQEEEIVVVLPQEYMLFPVLNAIPNVVKKLNVTMGYPLKETPLFGLMEAAIELQEHASLSPENGLSFYHKPAIDILSHPYLYKKDKSPIDKLIKDIRKKNQIRVYQHDILSLESTLLNVLFKKLNSPEELMGYLLEVIIVLKEQVVERFGLEREYLHHFTQMLSRLDELFGRHDPIADFKTLKSLLKKASQSIKIPFNGEPVNGLQIMGTLETRNLDFKYVLMLNMNEDVFPGSQKVGSFIPYRIRKAFALSTFETQDAIYAYLFYRLFHRSEKLSFYYNTYANFGLSGEVSRFIRQISLESSLHINWRKLSNAVQVKEKKAISIPMSPAIWERLKIYTDAAPPKERRRLSASALNIYFDCSLKFYFRYVLRLFSRDEMSEQLDARHFGNALHKTLEYLYRDTISEKGSRVIDENDFLRLENSIDGAMEKAFKEEFGMTSKKRFQFKDRNVVMAEIIKRFVERVIKMDKAYAPFKIVSLEDEDKYDHLMEIKSDNRKFLVKLGADIDRVDIKDGQVRIIDYKTGRDDTEIGNMKNLFNPQVSSKYKSARKAGFQTFFYAWLYAKKYGVKNPISAGLLNIKQFFQPDFDFRIKIEGRPVKDVRSYLTQFEADLKVLLEDIFSSDQSFKQTEDRKMCSFCDFKGICER